MRATPPRWKTPVKTLPQQLERAAQEVQPVLRVPAVTLPLAARLECRVTLAAGDEFVVG